MRGTLGSFIFDREVSKSELENALNSLDTWKFALKSERRIAETNVDILMYGSSKRNKFIFIVAHKTDGNVRNVNVLVDYSLFSPGYPSKLRGYLYTLQEKLSTEITIKSSVLFRQLPTGQAFLFEAQETKLGPRPVGWRY
jgi:hypothetical protein